MKTKHGYLKVSNGFNTYFIPEEHMKTLGQAIKCGNILGVMCLSVLELDSKGKCVTSAYPNHVRDETALRKELKNATRSN